MSGCIVSSLICKMVLVVMKASKVLSIGLSGFNVKKPVSNRINTNSMVCRGVGKTFCKRTASCICISLVFVFYECHMPCG